MAGFSKNSFSKVTEVEASLEGVENDRGAGVETVKCGLPSLPLNKEELRSIDTPLSWKSSYKVWLPQNLTTNSLLLT